MSFSQAFSVIMYLLFASAPCLADKATQKCIDLQSQTPIYKSAKICDERKSKNIVTKLIGRMQNLSKNGFCEPDLAMNETTLKQICTDPAGFVCSLDNGKVFDQNCELQQLGNSAAAQLPSYVEIECNANSEIGTFLNNHKKECPKEMNEDYCFGYLKAKHVDEIADFFRKHIYTPERIARLNQLFNRVKTKEIELIQKSQLVPENMKALLISRLNNTTLDLPIDSKTANACTVPGPDGPSTDLFYSLSKQGDKIEICIGAMAQLDSFNDYDLMHTLAHETAHSIDPCTLESLHDPNYNGAQTYPNLLQCLHGGSGKDGCTDAIINCNDDRGIKESCEESVKENPNDLTMADCLKERESVPSCSIGPIDPTYNYLNLADYRKGTDPINQIQESFADYFGAETTGQLAKEDDLQGSLSIQKKIDGLLTLAEDNVRLHGNCMKTNTYDSHPVGFLRMNRVIMGSKDYREAFCGIGTNPPKTNGADITCPGI